MKAKTTTNENEQTVYSGWSITFNYRYILSEVIVNDLWYHLDGFVLWDESITDRDQPEDL